MSEIIGLPALLTGLEATKQSLMVLGQEEPHKAYLAANALAKVAKEVQDAHKDGFKSYYDTNKELPGGFTCSIRTTPKYEYSEDAEWVRLSELLKARESVLKQATEAEMKGNMQFDENGEQIKGVKKTFTESYAVTRK